MEIMLAVFHNLQISMKSLSKSVNDVKVNSQRNFDRYSTSYLRFYFEMLFNIFFTAYTPGTPLTPTKTPPASTSAFNIKIDAGIHHSNSYSYKNPEKQKMEVCLVYLSAHSTIAFSTV